MPTRKIQQKYLDKFRHLCPIYIADKDMLLYRSETGKESIIWLNRHALISQELKEDSVIMGEFDRNSIKDSTDVETLHLKNVVKNIIQKETICPDNKEISVIIDLQAILEQAKKNGYVLNGTNAASGKYRIHIKGAFYNLTFLDAFSRIMGTTLFLCEQTRQKHKNIMLYPVINGTVQEDIHMFQLEAWPGRKETDLMRGYTYEFSALSQTNDKST